MCSSAPADCTRTYHAGIFDKPTDAATLIRPDSFADVFTMVHNPYVLKKRLYNLFGPDIMFYVESMVKDQLSGFNYALNQPEPSSPDTDCDVVCTGADIDTSNKRYALVYGLPAYIFPLLTDDCTQLYCMLSPSDYEDKFPRRFDETLYRMNYKEFAYTVTSLEQLVTKPNANLRFSRAYNRYLDAMYEAYVPHGHDVRAVYSNMFDYYHSDPFTSESDKEQIDKTVCLLRFFWDEKRLDYKTAPAQTEPITISDSDEDLDDWLDDFLMGHEMEF